MIDNGQKSGSVSGQMFATYTVTHWHGSLYAYFSLYIQFSACIRIMVVLGGSGD